MRHLTRRPVPGNTLAEAWQLWEVPVARLLEGITKEQRAKTMDVLGIPLDGDKQEEQRKNESKKQGP